MSDQNYDHITDPYLRQVIDRAQAQGLSSDDIAKALEAYVATRTPPKTLLSEKPAGRFLPLVQQLLLLFFLGAVIVFLSIFWSAAANNIRIMLTLGLGLVLQLVAVMFWQRKDKRHLSYTLMPVSVLFQCGGWWALLAVLFPAAHQAGLILPPIMMTVVLSMQLGLYRFYRLGMLFSINVALAYGLLFVLMRWLNVYSVINLLTLGTSMLCLGLSLPLTAHARQANIWQFIGGLILFTACFKWAKGDVGLEMLYFISVSTLFFAAVKYRYKGVALVTATAIGQYVIYVGMATLLLTSLWAFTFVLLAILLSIMAYGGMRLWRYYGRDDRLPVRHYLSRAKWKLRRIIPFSPTHS
jgi:hypothetical protein